MIVYCPNCEKSTKGKIIATWSRKIIRKDYRDPRYMLDDDGDSWDLVGFGRSVTIQKYHRVLIFNHNRGILRRHQCLGSGKKIVTRGRKSTT